MTSYHPFSVSQNGLISFQHKSDQFIEFLGPYDRKLPRSGFEIEKLICKKQLGLTFGADKNSFKIYFKEVLPSGFNSNENLLLSTYIFCGSFKKKNLWQYFSLGFLRGGKKKEKENSRPRTTNVN